MEAAMSAPDLIALLSALGVDVDVARKKVEAWRAAHPGLSPALEDIYPEVAKIDAQMLAKGIGQAWGELLQWASSPQSPIIEGDTPSNFG